MCTHSGEFGISRGQYLTFTHESLVSQLATFSSDTCTKTSILKIHTQTLSYLHLRRYLNVSNLTDKVESIMNLEPDSISSRRRNPFKCANLSELFHWKFVTRCLNRVRGGQTDMIPHLPSLVGLILNSSRSILITNWKVIYVFVQYTLNNLGINSNPRGYYEQYCIFGSD